MDCLLPIETNSIVSHTKATYVNELIIYRFTVSALPIYGSLVTALPTCLYIKVMCISSAPQNIFECFARCSLQMLLISTNGFNLLKPTVQVMHQPFDILQLYALPTQYLRVLYLSENRQRLVPLTA